ncbi:MAG: class I SAM-dependent methyltransferase [Pirellulales bacterium]
MISCPTVEKRIIRSHYDLGTLFYRILWGPHVHHGLWHADESPQTAQLQLTKEMARLAGIRTGDAVIDIGCGMGGSSIWLSKELECRVTGVTISGVQRRWAATSAALAGVGKRTKFIRTDAEQVEFDPQSFDVLWSIECTEHLFDKPKFFSKAAQWLKPGGKLAVCAWLSGHNEEDAETKRLVYEVCEGFYCPSLGTQKDYEGWFTDAGLKMVGTHIWTDQVWKTWEICRDRVRKTGVRHLARMLGQDHLIFIDRFDAILEAYKTHAMEYGCFIAEKPA